MKASADIALGEIEELVDKIRYACQKETERRYLSQLLSMFDPDTGNFIHDESRRNRNRTHHLLG